MDFRKLHELCNSKSCAEVARVHGVGVSLAALIVCEMGEKEGEALLKLVSEARTSLASADRGVLYDVKKHRTCHNTPSMAKTLKSLGLNEVPEDLVSPVAQAMAEEAEKLWWAS